MMKDKDSPEMIFLLRISFLKIPRHLRNLFINGIKTIGFILIIIRLRIRELMTNPL